LFIARRLPKAIRADKLAVEAVALMEQYGVEIKCGAPAPSVAELKAQGYTHIFFAVGAWAVRRWLRKIETNGAEAANAEFGTSAQWMSHLPVMSAVLPFLLLIMVTLRLPQANLSPIFGLALVLVVLLLGLARQLGNGLLPLVALGCVAALEAVAPETYRSSTTRTSASPKIGDRFACGSRSVTMISSRNGSTADITGRCDIHWALVPNSALAASAPLVSILRSQRRTAQAPTAKKMWV
jgi:hypothetical protein